MFEIHVTRSHYDQIIVGAANTANREPVNDTNSPDPIWVENGWVTRYDGGGQTACPGVYVTLYSEASVWGMEEGKQPFLYALVTRGHLRVALRHPHFSTGEMSALENGGLDLVESAYRWVEEGPESAAEWEALRSVEDLPQEVLRLLLKGEQTVADLFGQGGDFFRIK